MGQRDINYPIFAQKFENCISDRIRGKVGMGKMNSLMAALIIAIFFVAVSSAPPKYPTKYDNLNIDNIISNERLLTSYINCILDKGPCTSEGREFRKRMPEAIESACDRCTEGQKKMIRKAAKHIMDNRKAEWEQIKKKYDPKALHVETFNRFMSEATA